MVKFALTDHITDSIEMNPMDIDSGQWPSINGRRSSQTNQVVRWFISQNRLSFGAVRVSDSLELKLSQRSLLRFQSILGSMLILIQASLTCVWWTGDRLLMCHLQDLNFRSSADLASLIHRTSFVMQVQNAQNFLKSFRNLELRGWEPRCEEKAENEN